MWTKELKLQLPIVAAPMAGVSKPRLVIACAQAGILGSLGAGMLSPDAIRKSIAEIRTQTSQPFNVNLFVINNRPDFDAECGAVDWIKSYSHAHNYEFKKPDSYAFDFKDQFEAALEAKPAILSFAFGIITSDQLKACKDRGIRVIGTATSLSEALAWQNLGADSVCLQGIEAGGHRGNFLSSEPGIPLSELVDQALPNITVPIIAAGGIMDGKTASSYLKRGVTLVQMGTAFLAVPESEIAQPWTEALKGNLGTETELTPLFSGRLARGIVNRFMNENRGKPCFPYPVQNAYTAGLRKQAGERKESQDMSLWAGTNFTKARFVSLQDLVSLLQTEMEV